MADPAFRPATKGDEAAVRSLIFSVLREYGMEPSPQTIDLDLYDIEGYYAGGAFEVLVEGAGALMGTLGLKRLDETRCELRKMYLERKHRGKGYGRRLLDRAIARARELGFSRIELETASVLKEAIALYERYGFTRLPHSCCTERCDRAYGLDL